MHFKLGIVFSLVVVGLGSVGVFQYQTNQKLVQKNIELTAKLDQFSSLAKENEHLSNQLAQISRQVKFSQDQMNELLRLRSEVAAARNSPRDRRPDMGPQREHQPRQQEQKPTGSSLFNTNITTTTLPSISKSQWTYSGYDTPEAALQSVMYAMSQGDYQSLQAGLSTDALRTFATEFDGRTEDEITAGLVQKTSGISELNFNRRTVGSDGHVTFSLSGDGNSTMVVSFVKVDGSWKMSN